VYKRQGGQSADVVLNNTVNGQQIIVDVPFVVTSVAFDPERHLIAKNSTITLANESFTLDQAIAVYPNPTNAVLHLQMPTTTTLEKVTVYNNLGQVVLEEKGTDLNVSSLAAGVHYLDIQTTEGVFHKRFIKK
jgi:hypothetical protein